MAELKTKKNKASVAKFLASIDDDAKRKDARKIHDMMKKATGKKAEMWGTSIVGFGTFRYKGRASEGDWFLTGFSPRKGNLTLYLMSGFSRHAALMKKLGKYKTGKACLYIKRLEDVDRDVLRTLIERSVAETAAREGKAC